MRYNLLNLIAILALAVVLLASCRKCQDCTCATTTEEVCEDNFQTIEEYDAEIEALKDLKCECS